MKECNLIVANYSLPFCNKDYFYKMWNEIKSNLLKNGFFVGNFFGINDSWYSIKKGMMFLEKEQVINLFNEFELIDFREIEKDGITGQGRKKHWHIYNVIARKK